MTCDVWCAVLSWSWCNKRRFQALYPIHCQACCDLCCLSMQSATGVTCTMACMSRAGREPGFKKQNQDNCFAFEKYITNEQSLFGAFDGHGPNGRPCPSPHCLTAALLVYLYCPCLGLTLLLVTSGPAGWHHQRKSTNSVAYSPLASSIHRRHKAGAGSTV